MEVGICECALLPGCASRPREGGRAASEVDHHARPLAARWRGWNEASAGGTNRRDFSKGLLDGTSRRDFSEGLLEGTFRKESLGLVSSSSPSILIQWRRRQLAGAALRPLVHVGGGVDRRAVYHEEQAALREALELGRRRLMLSGRCQLW